MYKRQEIIQGIFDLKMSRILNSKSVEKNKMSSINVRAGDFLKGHGSFGFGSFVLRTEKNRILGETIRGSELELVETATEQNVKKLAGTVGWGIVGGAVLGPLGLLGGLLLGGRKKEVTFVAKFKDGRKMLATTDPKIFIKIQAAAF